MRATKTKTGCLSLEFHVCVYPSATFHLETETNLSFSSSMTLHSLLYYILISWPSPTVFILCKFKSMSSDFVMGRPVVQEFQELTLVFF